MTEVRLEESEQDRLVDDLYAVCGLDYRGWLPSVLAARLRAAADAEGATGLATLRARVLDDARCRARLVRRLAPRIEGPFPDVEFARRLRQDVCPRLRTYPSIRIWHAGCSTGEEVYTTAIILREEGLEPRVRIYATDHSEALLEPARAGLAEGEWDEAAARYLAAGGTAVLAEYYRMEAGRLVARPALRQRVSFDVHSLTTDASFNEFQLIVCRGALAPLAPSARRRALRVMYDSLCRFGFLAIGPGEARGELPDGFEPAGSSAGSGELLRRVR